MQFRCRSRRVAWAAGLMAVCPAMAASPAPDAGIPDALSLESAPEAPARAGASPLKMFVEGGIGRVSNRYGLGSDNTRRAALDINWADRLGSGWRFGLSNRTDYLHPAEAGTSSTINSLREAFVGWQDNAGRIAIEAGRVNMRLGPGYGFNPTDYFRDGSVRVVTSVDPLAQRDNRLGTVMLRGQRMWEGGAVTAVLAPKLKEERSSGSFNPDWGATNHSTRLLVSVADRGSGSLSGQANVFYERGKGFQLGASGTALVSDAAVAYVEWSGGRDFSSLSGFNATKPVAETGHRLSTGLTYTLPTKLALTVELQYNGFAAKDSSWSAGTPSSARALEAHLMQTQLRQDIGSRRGALVYVTQRDAFVKRLDLAGFVQFNLDDSSRLAWVEARYHWDSVDLALQYQRSLGKGFSEFGYLPTKQAVQVFATLYF